MKFRSTFAAAHVVMLDSYRAVGHALDAPGDAAEIAAHLDWDATMALRCRLDRLGFGVAEAMDTAQRFYLGWDGAARLIRECGALHLHNGFVAGAGVDHLVEVTTETELIDAVCWQIEFIQGHGGIAIVLPLLFLPQRGYDADGYVRVYREIIAKSRGPLLVHWLGAMFLPALRGYFPGDSFRRVMALDPATVRGCKLSLLDADLERDLRRELRPCDQLVWTGDDFHFADLIRGAGPVEGATRVGDLEVATGDFSHALLGIFDAIAAPASRALHALELGDVAEYERLMRPCERLGQHVFAAPTAHYKAGLAFLSWLNGLQDNFMLVNREDRARDRAHLLRCAELAREAGALEGEVAEYRLAQYVD